MTVFKAQKDSWKLIKMPNGAYLVNSENPFQSEKINTDELARSHYSNLFLKADNDIPIFYYVFAGHVFNISGAQNVTMLPCKILNPNDNSQILIILSDNKFHFYAFSEDYPDTFYKHLHTISASAIMQIPTSKVRPFEKYISFNFSSGFFTFNYKVYDKNNHYDEMLFFFNSHEFKVIELKGASTVSINAKSYIITPDGIFDKTTLEFLPLKKLFQAIGKNYRRLCYNIFYTPSKRAMVFVSKEIIPIFDTTENKHPLAEYKKGITVEGILYDVTNEEFVCPDIYSIPSSDLTWLKFFLYDDGIPHVFEYPSTSSQNEFATIFWDERHNKFSSIISVELPTFVSYRDTISAKKRVIFAKKKRRSLFPKQKHYHLPANALSTDDLMFVLNEELSIIAIDNRIQFETYLSPTNFVIWENETALKPNKIFYLSYKDFIIFKSCKSELGEMSLLFLGEDFGINYDFSFISYGIYTADNDFAKPAHNTYYEEKTVKSEKFLKVMVRKNDFENDIYYVSFNTHKIYSESELTQYLANNISFSVSC